MNIQERMARDNNDDKIYLGEIVEKMFSGENGQLFKALCNDIKEKTTEISSREGSKLPADRYLGRIEAIDNLTTYLVLMVANMRTLKADIKESQRV